MKMTKPRTTTAAESNRVWLVYVMFVLFVESEAKHNGSVV